MEYNRNYGYYVQEQTADFPATFAKLMRNVFSWMTLALIMTALTAMYVAESPNILYAIASNKLLMWGMFGAEIGLVLYMSARIQKMSFLTAGLVFAAYAILNGVTMSFIFLAYTMQSIAQTFFITAGTFGTMAVAGYVTKKNLSTMGRILTMLLIGLVIATIVNIFMASSGLAMILNYVGVLVFVGLTAYDTQKIKNMLQEASQYGYSEETGKLALLGSLTLYLDFVNLFLYLLRFFGNRK